MSGNLEAGDATHARFPSQTQWTNVVERASDPSSPAAEEALEQLFRAYWFPVYAFLRSGRIDSHRAKDLTQGFFVHVLQSELIKEADRDKGRFRTFLLACLRNFLRDEARRDHAKKRGGKAVIVPIDEADAEEKYGQLRTTDPAPEAIYDRTWAATVIEEAMEKLGRDYDKRGKAKLFQALQGCLRGEVSPEAYAERAAALGMSKGTFETNLSRFRDAFGKRVREVISETVNPDQINDEIKYLMTAWAAHLNAKS